MSASLNFASCVDRFGWVLVHSLWQFVLLALGALVLQRVMLRCSAVARYWTLLLMMCAMTLAPVATWSMLPPNRPTVAGNVASGQAGATTIQPAPVSAEREAADTQSLMVTSSRELELPALEVDPPSKATSAANASIWVGWSSVQDRLRPWLAAIVWAWCFGVLAFATRPLLSWYTVHRLRTVGASAVPASVHSVLETMAQRLGLRRAVQILQSTLVQAPVVVGYFRPVILVPLSAVSGLTITQLEAILAHELAHIRRHDYLVNLLQTLVETVFFYHPAVWWLSRQIRNERENCCDDVAVAVLGSGVDYSRALLAVAELHNTSTALALGVRGGSLLGRVRRILEGEPSQHVLGGGMLVGLGVIVAATIVVLSALAPAGDTPPAAASASVAPAVAEQSSDPSWGEVSNGLRARLLAVAPETDEQKPGWETAKRQATFVHGRDLTLLVELQNVSDEPLALLGTRTSASGKSDSERFAPLLFDCELFDKRGRPLEGSSFQFQDSQAIVLLSFGQAETLKPTASLVVLLRPGKWDAGLAENLEAGDHRLRVHYHGPAAGVLREMKQTGPQSPLASVWTGDAASGEASFRIAGGPGSRPPDLAWGEPVNGLRAAVEFRSAAETPPVIRDTRDLASVTFPLGSQLDVYLHVKNTSSRVITFWSEALRQLDAVMLIDEGGKETRLSHAISYGRALQKHWTLKPGQTAILQAMPLGIFADEQAAKKFEHRPGPVIIGKPGKYRLRYDMHLSDTTVRTSKDGQLLLPGESDWRGRISTGIATIIAQMRAAEPATVAALVRTLADKPSAEEARAKEAALSAPSTRIVRGKVVDKNRLPVVGAEVWLPIKYGWPAEGERQVRNTRTDSQGRFTLEVPEHWLAREWNTVLVWVLWVYAPRHSLGVANAGAAVLHGDPSDVIDEVGPTSDTSFVVLGPDGQPLPGAAVEPRLFETPLAREIVPEELMPHFRTLTDAEGRVRFPGLPRKELFTVRIIAKGLGIQEQRVDEQPNTAPLRTIRLGPVGRIEGRILADKPEVVRGVRLALRTVSYSHSQQPPPWWPIEGFAVVETDSRGRFAVPAIATGALEIGAAVDETLGLQPKLPEHYDVNLKAGQTTTVELPMIPTVPVRGSIRVQGTLEPVPKTEIFIQYGVFGHQGTTVVSGADGKFAARVLPGQVRLQVIVLPEQYARLHSQMFPSAVVPNDAKEFELPPIEVAPARILSGRLIDEHGRPVAEAMLSIIEGDRYYGVGSSDKEGRFSMGDVPATVDPTKATYHVSRKTGAPAGSGEAKVIRTNPLVLCVKQNSQ